jgi:hypothetical protein
MKPLKSRKNPVIAAVLAVILGGIGLGIYLRSWRDAGVGLAITLVMNALIVQIGLVGLLAGMAGLALYAVQRVTQSNAELERRAQEAATTLVPA